MSISEKIFGVATDNILIPKVEDATAALIDNNFVDKRLEQNIVAELLEAHGNEPFYNDFDEYISQNDVIKNLIKSVRGSNSLQPNFRTGFVQKNDGCFLSQYPK